jgi:hypothetical protein
MQTTPLNKTFEHTLTPELSAEIEADWKAEEEEYKDEDTAEEEETPEGQSIKSFKPSSSHGLSKALLVVMLTVATFYFCGDWFVPLVGLPGWPIILGICAIPWVVIALLV